MSHLFAKASFGALFIVLVIARMPPVIVGWIY